jgi:hypothetical protein
VERDAFRTSWEKVFDAVEHVVTFGLEHRVLGQIDAIRLRAAMANSDSTMRVNNRGGLASYIFTGQYSGNAVTDLLLGYHGKASRSLGDTRKANTRLKSRARATWNCPVTSRDTTPE